ncbi:MAG TPA: isoprenylcysteine carboxylmethyltransferase family protein [Terriglobales bacterium]|nr:isoprenylcysteine carboxylmethyltransferase family protein [Terriglobales bacterium]
MTTVVLGALALVAWGGFEFAFRTPGEAGSLRRDRTDRASTPLLIVAFALAIVVPIVLWQASIGTIGRAAWIGVLLAAAGLVVRAWSMRTLGQAYSRTLRTATGQRLVATGPYRWVRHPGYLGSIAVWVGASLAFHSWLSALIVAVIMLLAYGWRIQAEERMLMDHFGDDYRSYAARTARLIPGIY